MEKQRKFAKFTKMEWSWILQDWANSVYSLMITTALLPLFYKSVATQAGLSGATSTAYLGYANSIATLVVSLAAPVLGALADYKGFRNPMFTLGTVLGIVSVLGMMFVNDGNWQLLLACYTLSAIGFSTANIFYDSSIMDVTTRERLDYISSMGFAFGYMGSVVPFVLFIVCNTFKIMEGALLVRFGFLLTAIWWFVFTIPYWRHVKQVNYIEREPRVLVNSFKRLFDTMRNVRAYRNAFLFLVAYFFYIDGVNTIIKMATSVGSDLGVSDDSLIIILLVSQLVAFPCSIIYGILARRFGNKNVVFLGIMTYIIICVFALHLKTDSDFLLLAIMVGTAQGGIQALSRSFFGQLIPKEKANEFFGFYNICGKFAAILGPLLLAVVAQHTGNSLNGVFALLALFIIGGILLLFVKPSVS